MSKYFTTKDVIKKINGGCIDLYKGEGYWYFVFDDGVMHETESVYCMYLNHLPLDRWVEIGDDFMTKVRKMKESANA